MTRSPGRTGWGLDPTGRFDERLQVGGEWTQRVRCAGQEAIDPVDVEADDPNSSSDPAGDGGRWVADPARRFDQRWWDGRRWTRHVRSRGRSVTDASAPPTGGPPRGASVRTSGRDPGWRPDPDGRGQRYWDGRDWTAKRRDVPPPGPSLRPGGRAWWARRVVVAVTFAALAVLVVVVAVTLLLT